MLYALPFQTDMEYIHMHKILAIALPIIVLVLMLTVVGLLRTRLRVPGLKHVPDLPAYIPRRTGEPTTAGQWQQITALWNRWITGPLAFLVGLMVVASAAWLLAYLGWIATWAFDRPLALKVTPPWFHSLPSLMLAMFFGIVRWSSAYPPPRSWALQSTGSGDTRSGLIPRVRIDPAMIHAALGPAADTLQLVNYGPLCLEA